MFDLKFAINLDNNVFSDNNLKVVQEDYYKIDNLNFCLADGVTRDDINGNAVSYPKNKKEAIKWIENYPSSSGSYECAKIICEEFIKSISQISDNEITEKNIKDSIIKANKELLKINDREIDYLKNDLYCCVAVGGKITDKYLYAFSIGDCHITIFNKDFEIIFNSINNHKQFEEFKNSAEWNLLFKNSDWKNNDYRRMVRRDYRNNPNKKYNGKNVSFGVLSGEENAIYYIDTYTIDLANAKYICIYSDGCEMYFSNKNSVRSLLENPEIIKNEGVERSLIIYEKI